MEGGENGKGEEVRSEDKELALGLLGLVPGGTAAAAAAVQTDAPSHTRSQKNGKGYPAPSGTHVLDLFPGFCHTKKGEV